MGCFAFFRCRKKMFDHFKNESVNAKHNKRTSFTELKPHEPTLKSAPPSFRTRIAAVRETSNSRTRAFSAPSSLNVVDNLAFHSTELDDHEDSNSKANFRKEFQFSDPLPLPLPLPRGNSTLRHAESFKSATATSGFLSTSGPLPLPSLGSVLRSYSYEEILSACQHFAVDRCVHEGICHSLYKANFGDDFKSLEATVMRLLPSSRGFKDFVNEVNILASLQHPQLCKLLGFHARETSDQRIIVYERLYHGSLDRLLYGRSDGPSIDWSMRMKIALCAAKGLMFLHEEGPFQAMYNEFSTVNIQIDKDFSAKLSGYGCVCSDPELEISNTSAASANLSLETLERGLLTPKSNVWSFGIVLLELLTGRKNYDPRHPKEERNIVKWSKLFLSDDCRLTLIMDPQFKGRCPPQAARTVADIILKCLRKDPSDRPTMRAVVESLEAIQTMKSQSRFPLQDPSELLSIMKSPSFGGGVISPAHPSNLASPTTRAQLSSSPPIQFIQIPQPPRELAAGYRNM